MVKDERQIKRILKDSRTIAAVGLSSKPERPSNGVCSFLVSHGYRVIPVNPNETEVLGEKAYPDLKSVPVPIDVVQIFRKPEFVPDIVRDAIAIGAKVVWMQDGSGNPFAAGEAEEAGLDVVVNDCMLRQYRRLMGK